VWTVPATVVRIVDGDTVELNLDLGWRITMTANCRILGINAPELSTAAGQAARSYAEGLLPPGAEVVFQSRKLDKYGRPLGDILYQGGNFGTCMVIAGHARTLTY
jgi:endonuclease YncB( thermonuclease family)